MNPFQYPLGDGGLFFRERHFPKEGKRLLDAHARYIVDRETRHFDSE
jgi:hypothetical protein